MHACVRVRERERNFFSFPPHAPTSVSNNRNGREGENRSRSCCKTRASSSLTSSPSSSPPKKEKLHRERVRERERECAREESKKKVSGLRKGERERKKSCSKKFLFHWKSKNSCADAESAASLDPVRTKSDPVSLLGFGIVYRCCRLVSNKIFR